MTEVVATRRDREAFRAATVRVFCEASQVERVVEAAAQAEGAVMAEIASEPRPLFDGEWAEVDEVVNCLADFLDRT